MAKQTKRLHCRGLSIIWLLPIALLLTNSSLLAGESNSFSDLAWSPALHAQQLAIIRSGFDAETTPTDAPLITMLILNRAYQSVLSNNPITARQMSELVHALRESEFLDDKTLLKVRELQAAALLALAEDEAAGLISEAIEELRQTATGIGKGLADGYTRSGQLICIDEEGRKHHRSIKSFP